MVPHLSPKKTRKKKKEKATSWWWFGQEGVSFTQTFRHVRETYLGTYEVARTRSRVLWDRK